MKKILSIALASLAITSIQAQDISDALRFSVDNLNGTARFRAMSGAFGALGGDLSSINVNPAGSSIFANNQAGFTISSFNIKNDSNYFGTKTSENNSSFDLNQAGGVLIFKDDTSDWKKFAVEVNYENARNLDNSIFTAGTNPTNSVDKYFLYYANANQFWSGISLGTLQNAYFEDLSYADQQAFLGYRAKIILPYNENDVNNTSYYTNVPIGGNYYQENSIESTGYNGKISFNGSGQYADKLSIGINLNAHFTDYKVSSSFYESNSNNTSTTNLVNRVRFNNDLYTHGNGFSFQLGALYKATKEIRLGLAYESPTWYTLTDELSQDIAVVRSSSAGELPTDGYDPHLTMIFKPYKLQTPSKYTGSFAYIFGKKGLISFDYAIKDYSNTMYRPKNDYPVTNGTLANLLNTAKEFKLGAEYKIEKFSLRGGYRFEESPYKNGKTMGDLTGYSGGIGYNFGNTKLDVAYSFAKRDYDQQMFSEGFTDSARISSKNNNVSLTLLFEL